ncbi:MAG: DNA repair protein RadC [Prosthecobacter sp.]|jgi:DNA repair protein RadC|nr:DNA repair protein RadC [Prosthecobacter sp.]
MSRIHDMPEDDRPRERLLRLGAGALSDAELLAIFINTGVKGENALQVAQRLLREQGSLRNLSRIEAGELAHMRALGPAKAAHLAAAFELGRRAEQAAFKETPLENAEQVYRFIGAELQSLSHESVRIILLNQRLCLMRQDELFRGTVNETSAHPREIVKKVLAHHAPAFVLVHNHPSGNPEPSDADRRLTRRVKDAADLMGLTFVDHVIIGCPAEGRVRPYFSFRDHGLLR